MGVSLVNGGSIKDDSYVFDPRIWINSGLEEKWFGVDLEGNGRSYIWFYMYGVSHAFKSSKEKY